MASSPEKYPQFSEAHQMFRKSLRDFVIKELSPHAERWEREKLFSREVFTRMGELGFLGVRYPEEVGGSGGDIWHTAVLCEELPRARLAGLTMGLLVQTDMATPIIDEIGTAEQKEEFLAPAIRGEKIAALGVSEPGAGSDVAAIRTMAKADGDDFIIDGQKTWITNGTRADFITLAVRTDPENRYGGISLFLFPTDTPGFSVGRRIEKIGNHCSDTAELFFENCRLPKRYLLGEQGHGFYYIMQNFQGERLVGALSGTAGAQVVLDDTLAYCRQRETFGRPLTKHQVVRHQLVDCETELEVCRALSYHAADLFERGVPCQREISMAKLIVAERAMEVIDRCVQLHGGMGYAEELSVARAWRDARLLRIGGGTSEVMKEILSKIMGM